MGDTELWLKLAERWPIVLLPPALVWWRRHPGQQMELEMKRPEILNSRFELELQTLRETAHLSDTEKWQAERNLCQQHARRLLSFGIKQREPRMAWELIRQSGLSTAQLLSGFRRLPNRS